MNNILIAFIVGVVFGVSGVILYALLASACAKRRTGRESAAAPENGNSPATPSPGALWAVPEAEAQPEGVRIAASTVDLAERIDETAKLFNQLTEEAYDRGLGVAMKLEQEYEEEFSEEQEEPSRYELKVLVYYLLRVAELREGQCCGGAHEPPSPPPPSAHLSPSAPRRAGQAEPR